MKTFGVVIPAFNEADNLARVLEAVCAADWLAHIVIVDDGSRDCTLALAQQYAGRDPRLTVLPLPENRGKAAAMLAGVQVLATDFVIFLDADLIGLTPAHLQQLRQPVLLGESEVTVAVFRNGKLLTDASHRLTPLLSGQRCLSRLAAQHSLAFLAHSKFGIETGLTYYAKRLGWRCQYIDWNGITHVMKEFKLGYRAGLQSRWRMYSQILLTIMFISGVSWPWPVFWRLGDKPLLSRRVSAMVGVALFLVWFTRYEHLHAHTELRLHGLAVWQPKNHERILIFAPHPDDEVLAAGGVIGTVLAADPPAEVQVIVVTNGDASFSTALLNGYNPLAQSGYQKLAQARQQESLLALQRLGLPPEQIQFWGFPDRGLDAIWRRHWLGDKPYRSGFSGLTQTAGTLHSPKNIPYTGQALLAQLRQSLADFRPDAIILPHPQDAHPDHQALANFIILAAALNQAQGWSPAPQLFGYVMWLRNAPRPMNLRLDQEVQKLPDRFRVTPEAWLHFDPTESVLQTKVAALKAYQSQTIGLGGLLRRAGSGSELFNQLLLPHVPHQATPVSFPPEGQWQLLPYQNEYGLPGISSLVTTPGALWSTADASTLWLAAQLPRLPSRGTEYNFVIRLAKGEETAEIQVSAGPPVRASNGQVYVSASLPLEQLGLEDTDQVLMFSLQTRLPGLVTVARSQWQLLYLERGQ